MYYRSVLGNYHINNLCSNTSAVESMADLYPTSTLRLLCLFSILVHLVSHFLTNQQAEKASHPHLDLSDGI